MTASRVPPDSRVPSDVQPGLVVVHAGPRTTVQDLGRSGSAHLGVTGSGALDSPALALANRLVGNTAAAAGLETTMGGCALRAAGHAAVLAVTGALARVTVDGRVVDRGAPVPVPAGAVLTVGPALDGLRSYVAVAGGLDVPRVLGSRSTDTLSGLGPVPLRDGDLLPVGSVTGVATAVDVVLWDPAPDPLVLGISPGPRADWLTAAGAVALTRATWRVSVSTDRVGVRLEGPALDRGDHGELPSEGLVLGSVQVPADGVPLVFLADHPTTGGYPVVAVVDDVDLPGLAQARPGTRVRFTTSGGRRRPADRHPHHHLHDQLHGHPHDQLHGHPVDHLQSGQHAEDGDR